MAHSNRILSLRRRTLRDEDDVTARPAGAHLGTGAENRPFCLLWSPFPTTNSRTLKGVRITAMITRPAWHDPSLSCFF